MLSYKITKMQNQNFFSNITRYVLYNFMYRVQFLGGIKPLDMVDVMYYNPIIRSRTMRYRRKPQFRQKPYVSCLHLHTYRVIIM